jgi:hypothetical protein
MHAFFHTMSWQSIRKCPASLFFVLLAAACTSHSSQKNNASAQGITEDRLLYKKPPSTYADTLVIRGKAAVFYSPDSLQLLRIKAITDSMVYESDSHDCFFQMRNARLVIRKYWPRLQLLETSRARWLLFTNNDKSVRTIDLDSRGAMCGIFIFDGQKEPEPVDMTNLESAFHFYFDQ